MSWDVSIINFAQKYKSVDEIPNDEPLLPLGARHQVQEAILEFFPNTDWRDPVWGVFSSIYGSIEFSLGTDDPSTGVMLHVRASDEVVPLIVQLCKKNNWAALDCSSCLFLEYAENPEKGLKNWREYLAQILGK